MISIVHGSDLHFGAPHDARAAELFAASAEALGPDLIVLSGDFTQRAKVREYEAARAYLDRLPRVPVVVTPGNHDVPLYRVFERIFSPFRNYREHIRDELNTVTRLPGLIVVALNSAAPRRAIVNGRIDPHQIEFARRAFEEGDPDDLRAVVAHHHLAPAPDYEGDRPLPDARRILDAFEAMGVELVLGGHLHRAYIGNSLDVYPGEDRDRGVVIVQSGTTTSRRGRARERAKNSFNLVRVREDRLEVIHYILFDELDAFAPLSVHAFPRAPAHFFPWEDRIQISPGLAGSDRAETGRADPTRPRVPVEGGGA
jgi:3',5'-cyclic AMP phosphodiesterase CpdA